ncbi:tyrosine-type recombinase/integrase [Aquaspirillum soli]
MPTKSLTDARCKAFRPSADKDQKVFDGGGLFLFISKTGSKIWRMAYRFNNKPKTISFGSYPEISLSLARQHRDSVKAMIANGIDPMAARQAAPKKVVTFREAYTRYWDGRHDVSDGYKTNALRGLEMHLRALCEKDVGSISRQDLMAELNRMNEAGLFVYVRRVRMWAGQVFDWAAEQGLMESNPAAMIDPRKAFGKAKSRSFAALELSDVPAFMQRLSLETPTLQSVLACRMLAYTWVRTNELRMMRWDEIDLDEGIWLIPAGKMKRARDHIVPLPKQAVEILRHMKMRCRGSVYVWPNEHTITRPMSENAVLYLIRRIGFGGVMTGHGWRSVGSTWANEQGYNPDAIEMQLAHTPTNKTRAVYNRARYLDVRREMLQAHADWLDLCTARWNIDTRFVQRRSTPALDFEA